MHKEENHQKSYQNCRSQCYSILTNSFFCSNQLLLLHCFMISSQSGYFVWMVCVSVILSEVKTDFIAFRGSASIGSRGYNKYSDIKHILVTLEFTIFFKIWNINSWKLQNLKNLYMEIVILEFMIALKKRIKNIF